MAKNNYYQFEKANEYVINKDTVINHYIKYMLARTQSMFSYTGLPDTIPANKLEMMLQTKGYAFITEVNGKLYALYGGLGGMLDAYEDATEITVANVALNLSKTYNLENDGVLVNNDTMRLGLLPILNKYGALLAENTITMRTVDVILRMVTMISASDDRTFTGAEKFIRDIENGKISAIGESAFFDGIKVHSVANSQNYLVQFIELEQYLKASCFNEIGLNANYNMKREQIGSNESALNDDFLLPLVDNMIKERVTAIEKINEKYGTEISIDYASAWKVTHEENEKQVAIAESITGQIENGDNPDVTIDQKQGVHDIDRPIITIEGSEDNENTDTGNEHSTGAEVNDNGLEESSEQPHSDDAESGEVADSDTSTGESVDSESERETDGIQSERTENDTEQPHSDDAETENDTDAEIEEGEDDDRNKS